MPLNAIKLAYSNDTEVECYTIPDKVFCV